MLEGITSVARVFLTVSVFLFSAGPIYQNRMFLTPIGHPMRASTWFGYGLARAGRRRHGFAPEN